MNMKNRFSPDVSYSTSVFAQPFTCNFAHQGGFEAINLPLRHLE